MTLGERIVYYRKQAGLTQKALAESMDISATRLNYWEKDKREPDIKMVNELCRALNIDGDLILGREKSPSIASSDQSLLDSYHRAPQEIQLIVDTALKPYNSKTQEQAE